jgi:PhnB protein
MATKATRFIPEGYHSVTPYLYLRDAAKALEFYKRALNASELFRFPMPDGRIGHAEIRIGDSVVMLADEAPERGVKSPQTLGGTSAGMALYVEDCDALFKRAVEAGAKVDRPLADQFYGDRSGTIIDPFGHRWTISTHVEDVSPEEAERRMKQQKAS